MLSAVATGFAASLSLILAIGAQNAFVLRQGLRGQHVFAVCLACALSDAILIALGVGGFAALDAALPRLAPLMRIFGAAFLAAYGLRALWSAWRGGQDALKAAGGPAQKLGPVLATTLALTWLNPHVYLDTVLLLGAISARFGEARFAFGAGAVSASFVFFFALGYGAGLLRPIFATPRAWRVLDVLIGLVMLAIAAGLIAGI